MLTVAGLTPSLDLTYVVPDLRLGEIHRPTEAVRCAGGKPLNMARAASALGADTAVVAVLGGPTGGFLHAALEQAGIRVVDVATAADTRTCVSIASSLSGALTEVYQYAEPIPPEVWSSFCVALTATVASRPGWLSISGGPPKELAVDAIAELVRIGAAAGLRVALDTHGPALPAAVDARPAVVKVNRYEAADLLGVPAATELAAMAAAIRSRTAGLVVLTDAHLGALADDGTGPRVASLPGVRGSYPVGSGDAFLGGLIAELDRGAPLETALRTAMAAGTANALVPGPGVFTEASVSELAPRVRIRRP